MSAGSGTAMSTGLVGCVECGGDMQWFSDSLSVVEHTTNCASVAWPNEASAVSAHTKEGQQ